MKKIHPGGHQYRQWWCEIVASCISSIGSWHHVSCARSPTWLIFFLLLDLYRLWLKSNNSKRNPSPTLQGFFGHFFSGSCECSTVRPVNSCKKPTVALKMAPSWVKKHVPLQAPVVQTLDSDIHRINHYPAESVIDFPNTYPLDSDLSVE